MKAFCPIVFLFLTTIAEAQLLFGGKAGYNSSWATIDTRNIENTVGTNTDGFNVGAVVDYALNDYLSLRAELLLTRKGYGVIKYNNQFTPGVTNDARAADAWSLKSYNTELPVLLNYFFEGRKLKMYVGAGAYVAYWAAGTFNGSFFTNDLGDVTLKRKNVSEGYTFTNSFQGGDHRMDNRWDLGALANTAIAYKLKKGELYIEARYSQGFLDMNAFQSQPPSSYSPQYNRNWSFSIGYLKTIIKSKRKKTYQDLEEENPENEESN